MILAIDDEVDYLQMLDLYCRAWGFRFRGERDSLAGIRAARELVPDLIVLDLCMPRSTGYEVLRELRAAEPTRSIPVIMASGEGTTIEHRVTGLCLGAHDYLFKPFSKLEMKARIDNLLKLRVEEEARARRRELGAVLATANYLNHAVNNLLAVIRAAAELQADLEKSGLDPRDIQTILESVDGIHEIIRGLARVRQVVREAASTGEAMLDPGASAGGAPVAGA